MTTNKLVTVRISYTWKAHTPGPMSLMRFHFDECLNCCLHGWSQHYSGCGGLPDLSVLITEDASSPILPGAWMQRLFGSPRGRATHTMAANIVPTRKEVVFIFFNGFQQCLCGKARGTEKIPQRNMKAHLRSALGNPRNKHLVVLILSYFVLGWQNWVICTKRR